jgi:hypothetical protein
MKLVQLVLAAVFAFALYAPAGHAGTDDGSIVGAALDQYSCVTSYLNSPPDIYSDSVVVDVLKDPLRYSRCADAIRRACDDILSNFNAPPAWIQSCQRISLVGSCVREWFNPLIPSRQVAPFDDLDAHTIFWIPNYEANALINRDACRASILDLCGKIAYAADGGRGSMLDYNRYCKAILPYRFTDWAQLDFDYQNEVIPTR